ncbi:MAG: dicarboxylate/amino acid:cation symporter [Longimicrobiales bacterium]|nr:dicarboxylate/amino acid:cation symporter [Longimicrobiales bacterium]
MKLTTRILLALGLGAATGVAAQASGSRTAVEAVLFLEPLGTAFVRLISMVVVPLVVASLFVGTCSLGDVRRLGRIGGRSLAYFLVTTLVASTLGLYLAVLVRPGAAVDPAVRDEIAAAYASATPTSVQPAEERSLSDRLLEIIPLNPVRAAADMDLLPLIFATLLFGAAASVLEPSRREPLVRFFDGVNGAAGVVIDWAMRLAPYAVFVLIAGALARFGFGLLRGLLVYSLLVIFGEALHAFGVLSAALRLGGVNVRAFWRHIADAPLLAFSTASSNAALPVSLEVAQKRLGVSNEVASFVLPVGTTLSKNGSALYKGVTVVFLAQVYGVALGPSEHLTIVLASTVAAVSGVGVPGSSLVTTLIVLTAVGMGPQAAAGMALVVGLDRFLDMFRSGVNVVGQMTCAAIIAKGEGESLAA